MALSLSDADREQIGEWLRTPSTTPLVALRCRIVLAAARGEQDLEIAGQLGINRHTAALWRKRVATEGIGSVWKPAQGRGRKPRDDRASRKGIIQAAPQSERKGITHWTCRLNAAELHSIEPRLSEASKLSGDPRYLEKLTDVVGLYLNPPQRVLVLCGDAKGQAQALDRAQPGLTSTKGHHDGAYTVFSLLDRSVIGQSACQDRDQGLSKFLRRLDEEFPGEGALHLVMDNNETHKTPEVQQWLAHHPRFAVHFIPNGSSWVNLLERWFNEFTKKEVRRGAFVSLKHLFLACSKRSRAAGGSKPETFVWVATREIIRRVLDTNWGGADAPT